MFACLNIFGKVDQSLLPWKNDIISIPIVVVCTFGSYESLPCLKANFQSVEFSERAEILLFTRENVALKLNWIVTAEQHFIV